MATVLNFQRILKLRGQKVATVLKNKKTRFEGKWPWGGQLCSTASPPYARFSWFLEGVGANVAQVQESRGKNQESSAKSEESIIKSEGSRGLRSSRCKRERQRDRETERDTDTERETQRHRDTETQRQRDREGEIER